MHFCSTSMISKFLLSSIELKTKPRKSQKVFISGPKKFKYPVFYVDLFHYFNLLNDKTEVIKKY